jgi:peptide chain release factor 1
MWDMLDPKLESKLAAVEQRLERLSHELGDPGVVADRARFTSSSRTFAELEPVVRKFREYRKAHSEWIGAKELLESSVDGDAELRGLATEEVKGLEARLERLSHELKLLVVPADPNDARNVVLEIRAGTGGDEATLFAAEVFRMYSRYAEALGWKVQTTGLSESGVGGVKEVIAIVEGDRVYSRLKFESGVHRVQRVPATEAQGRIHTSAVTVAVMPEADEVDVEIEEKDLRIDTFCSSGPGGQSVNTTYSAVRIVHLPTNTIVQCQDERSYHKNKVRAMQVLRSRLYDVKLAEQREAIAKERRGLVKSGDRSEKIRTYNFPQSRITDHRINLTTHQLHDVLEGDITELLDQVTAFYNAEKLKQATQVEA